MEEFELSIVMVTYKCREVFKVSLDALIDSNTKFRFEIIVIDNDSRDGTAEMVEKEFKVGEWEERFQLVRNSNVGFPKANNQGLKLMRGRYALLLNPDTKVSPDTLQVMMDFMKARPDVGISTCKLIKANGELDKACRRTIPTPFVAFARLSGLSILFPNSKLFAKYNLSYKNENDETEVDACSGAFMFASPNALRDVGPMDERFYMYGEDLDWCLAVKEMGHKVWYYPKTTTVHYRGQSSKKSSVRSLYAFHDAMWLFFRKHFSRNYWYVLDPFVWVGVWARFVVKLVMNKFRSEPYISK